MSGLFSKYIDYYKVFANHQQNFSQSMDLGYLRDICRLESYYFSDCEVHVCVIKECMKRFFLGRGSIIVYRCDICKDSLLE